jgi:hypothetical protein
MPTFSCVRPPDTRSGSRLAGRWQVTIKKEHIVLQIGGPRVAHNNVRKRSALNGRELGAVELIRVEEPITIP